MASADVLERHANDRADYSAIVDGGRIITCRELDLSVSTVAANLAASGIDPGDVVAVVMSDYAEYLIAILGLTLVGAVMVGIDGKLPDPRSQWWFYKPGQAGRRVLGDDRFSNLGFAEPGQLLKNWSP